MAHGVANPMGSESFTSVAPEAQNSIRCRAQVYGVEVHCVFPQARLGELDRVLVTVATALSRSSMSGSAAADVNGSVALVSAA